MSGKCILGSALACAPDDTHEFSVDHVMPPNTGSLIGCRVYIKLARNESVYSNGLNVRYRDPQIPGIIMS